MQKSSACSAKQLLSRQERPCARCCQHKVKLVAIAYCTLSSCSREHICCERDERQPAASRSLKPPAACGNSGGTEDASIDLRLRGKTCSEPVPMKTTAETFKPELCVTCCSIFGMLVAHSAAKQFVTSSRTVLYYLLLSFRALCYVLACFDVACCIG